MTILVFDVCSVDLHVGGPVSLSGPGLTLVKNSATGCPISRVGSTPMRMIEPRHASSGTEPGRTG